MKSEVIKMSDYTAIIHCEKCGNLLAIIKAYHEPKADHFVPQDIVSKDFALPSMFCQKCLNGKEGDSDDSAAIIN